MFLGGVGMYLIDLSHQRDISNLELQLLEQKNEEIGKFFADITGSVRLNIGSADEQQEIVSETERTDKEIQLLLENMMNSNKAFQEISLISRDGVEVAKITRSSAGVELVSIDEKLPKYSSIIIDNKSIYISDVYYALYGPMITVSAPVYNFDGVLVRVISAEVSLDLLTRSLNNAKLGYSGYLILLDNHGSLIAHGSTKSIASGTDFSKYSRVQRIARGELSDSLDDRDYYESLIDKTPVVGAGKKLNDYGWLLLAEWPLSDANALMYNIRNQIVIMTLVSILAVLLFAPLFAGRLIKPIRQLETSAAEVEKGNFEYQVDINTKDELEELGEAFNKMTVGLKRLQELKNEFVFIAAHELRTPVTAIKGYLSMVFEEADSSLSASVKKYLDTASKANDRLVQLVNDILEIARSEAGRMKIEVSSVNLSEGARAIIEEVATLAADKKIKINYQPPDNLPLVLADSARLKEIIMNFISNAIKYNRDWGSITITHELAANKVMTHITDTGYGLSPEDQKHMFEKFFRSNADVVKKVQGTGLGLFITKELVEKMGGQVWVKSEKDKGSTFSFSLPRADL